MILKKAAQSNELFAEFLSRDYMLARARLRPLVNLIIVLGILLLVDIS